MSFFHRFMSTELNLWSEYCNCSPVVLFVVGQFISARLTSLLLFVIGEFLDGAAVAEAADRTGQPFSQSVSGAFGTRRAGLQRAEGWLRLKVRHWLRLSIRAANRIVFWKTSDKVYILVRSNQPLVPLTYSTSTVFQLINKLRIKSLHSQERSSTKNIINYTSWLHFNSRSLVLVS